MATGYTYPVKDNPELTFQEFAISCAHAFGGMIHLRDEGHDAPWVPDTVSTYHSDGLKAAEAELARFKELPLATKLLEFHQHCTGEVERCIKAIEERKETRVRYEGMLARVNAWVPPTEEHQGLKDFMIKQLEGSIDHDCNLKYDLERLEDLAAMSFTAWEAKWISKQQWNINYHTEELAKEIERVNGRNQWCQDLFASLEAYGV